MSLHGKIGELGDRGLMIDGEICPIFVVEGLTTDFLIAVEEINDK